MDIDYQKIIEKIKPGEWEKKAIDELADHLIGLVNALAIRDSIDAEAVLVGSVAKNTWLSGKADVDIFIKFPIDTSEDYLKEKGLYLGIECIKQMGGKVEYRYASHPYVTGLITTLEVDFVPCYDIKDAHKIKSAVDRTIPHTQYVKKHLTPEEADEVLLLKCFMKNIGTYGSEFKVGGFAGYLCELLIIRYKTFLMVLENAAKKWNPGYQVDLAGYGTAHHFCEHLVVVDPVDPNRNVGAALSLQKLSEFVVASRNFLENPSLLYFEEKEIAPDLGDVKEEFKIRGTKTLILSFKAPDVPVDALYPQINKTTNSMVSLVERNGFKTIGSDYWTDEDDEIIILLEFETWKLPKFKKHYGPPIWSNEHGEKFHEKYGEKAWLEDDRWVAGVEREHTDVQDLLETALSRDKIGLLKFGKHVKAKILKNSRIYDIKEFLELQDVEYDVLKFLYGYLHKSELLSR